MKKNLIILMLIVLVGCNENIDVENEVSPAENEFLNSLIHAEYSSEVLDLMLEGFDNLNNDIAKTEALETYNDTVLDLLNNEETEYLFNIFFSNYHPEIKEEFSKYMNEEVKIKVMERLNPVKVILDDNGLTMELLDEYKGIRNNRNKHHILEKLRKDNINYSEELPGTIILLDDDVVVEFNNGTSRRIFQIKDENKIVTSPETVLNEVSSNLHHISEKDDEISLENIEKMKKIEKDKKMIKIDMTDDEVLEKIGKPKKINRTITKNNVKEQWVYSNKYLYFENGILKTIQD